MKAFDGTIQPLDGGLDMDYPLSSASKDLRSRFVMEKAASSKNSPPPPGQILSGKQEHCKPFKTKSHTGVLTLAVDLKRELMSQQVTYEVTELASTTALQRFGAPFRSDYGEVAPVDSDLPILRYIFVHHVRNFPFLDQAREKEFWQDKLQVVWQSPSTPLSLKTVD